MNSSQVTFKVVNETICFRNTGHPTFLRMKRGRYLYRPISVGVDFSLSVADIF